MRSARRRALDPRVTYLVTSMLEDVINHGTGATVRARGFTAPAAGKTGTSRDGWFAGYTSNLLAIVWVGFDDNRDLGLSGANAPAPIWAEFMKRAVTLPAYRDVQPFEMPEGVTQSHDRSGNVGAGHSGSARSRARKSISTARNPLSSAPCMAGTWPAIRRRVPGYRMFLAGTSPKAPTPGPPAPGSAGAPCSFRRSPHPLKINRRTTRTKKAS